MQNRKDIMMRSRNNRWMDISRLAVKLGLILTDPKVRAEIQDEVKTRANRASDAVTRNYEEVSDRLEAAGSALQGRTYWPSRVGGFLLGVGVGAGIGLLLAPASGAETRDAIRDRAAEMKDRVTQSAANVSGQVRRSVSSMPATGTEG
jgi:gas vesicle protein